MSITLAEGRLRRRAGPCRRSAACPCVRARTTSAVSSQCSGKDRLAETHAGWTELLARWRSDARAPTLRHRLNRGAVSRLERPRCRAETTRSRSVVSGRWSRWTTARDAASPSRLQVLCHGFRRSDGAGPRLSGSRRRVPPFDAGRPGGWRRSGRRRPRTRCAVQHPRRRRQQASLVADQLRAG